MENPGFDPGASTLRTLRSSDWASPPFFYIYACACACAYDENIKNMLHPRRLGLGCSSLAMRTRLEFLTRFDKSDPYADRMRFIGW